MSLRPRRIYNRWKARLGIRKRAGEIAGELKALFPQLHSLTLSHHEGGFDSIFFLLDCSGNHFGVMRLNNPWQLRAPVYPALPRMSPPPMERIDREWEAYSILGPRALSPRPLWRAADAAVCTYSRFPNLRRVMEETMCDLTAAFTAVFTAIGRMHEAGVVHLDLSPGNVLICPESLQTLLIDFEYTCRPERTSDENRCFDWHRMLEKTKARAVKLNREREIEDALEAAVSNCEYHQAIRRALGAQRSAA